MRHARRVPVFVAIAAAAACSAVWLGRGPEPSQRQRPLPGSTLTDSELQTVRGGVGTLSHPLLQDLCETGGGMHISHATGSVFTTVPICIIQSANGPTIDLALHYNSRQADGSTNARQTVLGYGWSHTFNIYLIARSDIVFLSDPKGRLSDFRPRWDGGYTAMPGETHTLTRVDDDTFLVATVDGALRTFKLFDPQPWPEAGEVYQLTQIEDAQGRLTQLQYNGRGLLGTVTDPYGRQVGFGYSARGRIDTITGPDGVTRLTYAHADDDLVGITDPEGHSLTYVYNAMNGMTKETLKDGTIWRCVYNRQGRPYQLKDGTGTVLVTITNTRNWDIDLEYALQHDSARYLPNTTTITDGCGNTTINHCDSSGYIWMIETALGTSKRLSYNEDLRLIARCDEEGYIWRYEYDEFGNRTKITDPLDNVTTMSYEHDIPSLMTGKLEPDDDPWGYVYDGRGNLIEEIDPIIEQPHDRTITYTYKYYQDGRPGRLRAKTRTDRNGHTTLWEYAPDGTLQRETIDPDGLAIVTDYRHDGAGRMTRSTNYRKPGLDDPVVESLDYDAMGRLTEHIVDPGGLGLRTSFEYDGQGHLTRLTNPRRVVTIYEYDERGRLVLEVLDPDKGGALDALALTTQYEYDACDNLVLLIDRGDEPTYFEYDARNRVILEIDAEDYWTVRGYDPRGNEVLTQRSREPSGGPFFTITSEYDELGRLASVTEDPGGLGLTTRYEYATSNGGCDCGTPGEALIHKTTNPEGKVTYYYYDDLDRLTSIVNKVGDVNDDHGDSDDAITSYDYDLMNNVLCVTVEADPSDDLVTVHQYDATDRRTRTVVGSLSQLPYGYAYDGANNLIEETTPFGNVITSTFDKANRVEAVSDVFEAVVTYRWDENSNLLSRADGLDHAWRYEYDAADRVVKEYDPLIETPDDKYTVYAYEPGDDELRYVTDREGLITAYTYDHLDRRLTETQDPGGLGITVSTAYDGAGNVTARTDDNGNTTSYIHDGAHRLLREVCADETDVTFDYDRVGNRTTRIDQMDNVTTYDYDDLHRLIRRSYDPRYLPAIGYIPADVFAYDRVGRMLLADNHHSHIGRTYDDVGRITSSVQTDMPETYSYTVGYAYENGPGVNTRTLFYPSGTIVEERYDARERLREITQDGDVAASYEYDNPTDRILTKTFGNGVVAHYEYNANAWITSLAHVGTEGASTLAGFAHDYDAMGNRLNARNLQDVIPYDDTKPVTQSESYEYDAAHRLVDFKRGRWTGDGIASPRRHRTWRIDGVHNWTHFTIRDLDTGEEGRYCNSINQINEYDDFSTDGPPPVPDDDGSYDDFMNSLCRANPTSDFNGDGVIDAADLTTLLRAFDAAHDPLLALTADLTGDDLVDIRDLQQFVDDFSRGPSPRSRPIGHNRAHDKNGNLVKSDDPADDDAWEYFYDYDHSAIGQAILRAENRVTLARNNGCQVNEYWYDALGRRIRKLADGVLTVCVYTHDWHAIEERGGGSDGRTYAYGAWRDEVVAMGRIAAADRLYYLTNALGSIIAVTEETGAPVERYAYDTYGEPAFYDPSGLSIAHTAISNPYLFTARRYDTEIGWYNYRARYVDPFVGRFTTRDTIGSWYDRHNMGNGLAYVGNNPTTASDPSGRARPSTMGLEWIIEEAHAAGSHVTFVTPVQQYGDRWVHMWVGNKMRTLRVPAWQADAVARPEVIKWMSEMLVEHINTPASERRPYTPPPTRNNPPGYYVDTEESIGGGLIIVGGGLLLATTPVGWVYWTSQGVFWIGSATWAAFLDDDESYTGATCP